MEYIRPCCFCNTLENLTQRDSVFICHDCLYGNKPEPKIRSIPITQYLPPGWKQRYKDSEQRILSKTINCNYGADQ